MGEFDVTSTAQKARARRRTYFITPFDVQTN